MDTRKRIEKQNEKIADQNTHGYKRFISAK